MPPKRTRTKQVQVRGAADLTEAMTAAGRNVEGWCAQFLYQKAEEIMTRSKAEFVPVDTGVLRASGRVDVPRKVGGKVRVKMGYGGAAQAYAWIQHQNTQYEHKVGGPFYLITPTRLEAPKIPSDLARFIRTQLEKEF